MNRLFLDFESRSHLDVRDVGSYKYASHPSTEAILLGWAINKGEVQIWEPLRHAIPTKLADALETHELIAWNATFERHLFAKVLKKYYPTERWKDVMVVARYLSLPGSLEAAGDIVGLNEDEAKLKDGKRLIRLFSQPFTMGGQETLFGIEPPCYHDWNSHPRDWAQFIEYCKRDVSVERQLFYEWESLMPPEREWKLWQLDQKINDTGLPMSVRFTDNALALATSAKERLVSKLKELTSLENPNSNVQMLAWAEEKGYPYSSLGKEIVAQALATPSLPSLCREVLTLRKEASKTSFKKFVKIKDYLSEGDRLRGQFLFLGGARTGRWSGAGAQPQNQPRPEKKVSKKMDLAIKLILEMDREGIEKEFGSVINTITSCIRAACQAPEGYELNVCDLNAIENRVLGWLAHCKAILDVFAQGRDPYLAFAALMYNRDYDDLKRRYDAGDPEAIEMRQVAKPAVLGAGYGLGAGVQVVKGSNGQVYYNAILKPDKYGNIQQTGLLGYAKNMGVDLTPEQAYKAWKAFREAYPEVVKLWRLTEDAAVQVIEKGGRVKAGWIEFDRKKRKNGQFILRMKLPSGRYLHYLNARIEIREVEGKDREGQPKTYEKKAIFYDGIGHGVGKVQDGWGPTYTYGGKLIENADQAISRDILANGLELADEIGMEIVGHVHDEIITVTPKDDPFAPGLKDLQACMCAVPDWAPELPLHAEGYSSEIYKKG